ncbi:hypothetical protein [Galbitalea soli]|uniref:DUF2537 domain-containing protein n=1 Tax=Galbitalea soli TaxID=1268042 RepID=A0A7C9PMJ2_9MICO|nr:hypothetical protein [Galbitalea soli]NEM91010.1 hypothetical protein [Galbitalea soli]NYJ29697.1 hypothetical protein [Galbitalea soli]
MIVASRAALGIAAFLLAVATVVVVGVGISLALDGQYLVSSLLAYAASIMSVASVIAGLAALALSRGRGWGVAAVVLGVLANPLVLTRVLGWASGS